MWWHFFRLLRFYVLISVVIFALYFRSFLLNTCTCVSTTPEQYQVGDGEKPMSQKPMAIRAAPKDSEPAPKPMVIRAAPNDSKSASKYSQVKAEDIVAAFVNIPYEVYLAKNESFFVPRDHAVNNLTSVWLIQAPPCPAGGPSLLVVIPSMDKDKDRRKAIRETWASPAYGHPWPGPERSRSNYTVKVVFFLAVSKSYTQQTLEQEAEVHRDIVRADFVEAYHNLSLKMNVVLNWVNTYCTGARHVIKVDQDTFVNIPLLLDVLELFSTKQSRFVLGRKHGAAFPPVVRLGRWQVSKEVYPFPSFPRYMLGHSYVISGDAIKPLYHASQRMPLIPNEDAYVTGILAKSANMSRVHSTRIATVFQFNRCALVKGVDISQTGFNDNKAIYGMWDMLKTGNCSTH